MYRFLIVDDESSARDGLAHLVDWSDLGFEVVAVLSDGREAIRYVRNSPVDVVLTDVRMTFVSGIELAECVAREQPRTKVILLSGYRDFEVARQAIEYNVFHYLLKPFRLSEFTEVFRRLKVSLDEERSERDGTDVPAGAVCDDHITRAITYIDSHFRESISLESIADHVCVSTAYFCRLFRGSLGTTFIDYLNGRRVQEAITLITRTDATVREVSHQVGFNDVKYFYKVFRRLTGRTPTDYRNPPRPSG